MKPDPEEVNLSPASVMSQQLIKTEEGGIGTELKSSPATEALDFIADDNALVFESLNEMFRRDPTLSSLANVKEEPTAAAADLMQQSQLQASQPQAQFLQQQQPHQQFMMGPSQLQVNRGMPIPAAAVGKRMDVTLLGADGLPSQQQQQQQLQSAFGDGSSAGSNSNVGTSPILFPGHQGSSGFAGGQLSEMKMETDGPTLAQLNSPHSNENSLMKLDLDADFNDIFTNSVSRDVNFGMAGYINKGPQTLQGQRQPASTFPTGNGTAVLQQPQQRLQVPMGMQQQQQQQRVMLNPTATAIGGDDCLVFSTTSFSNQSGGAAYAPSKDLLSSSVPASNLSPLNDILSDIPTSPLASAASSDGPSGSGSGSGGAGLSPSHAGPERSRTHSHGHSTLHKLLLRKDPVGVGGRPSPVRSPENRKAGLLQQHERMKSNLSASNPLLSQQLSKSAPTQQQNYLDRVLWSRREPRQHISSVCSVSGNESSIADEVNEALSGISPNDLPDIDSEEEEEETSQNEGKYDSSQDDDSDNEDDGAGGSGGKKKDQQQRFFWQYNVQAKGPKGQKIFVETKIDDPHVLNDIVDPVFSGDVQLQGIKHSGKARRGDGNDLTANPKKLAAIGKELEQLGSIINDLNPASEMPFTTRCKSRKEKNKLASRACRLKKKAQHEANKVKCHGLEEEHHTLNDFLSRARDILRAKIDPSSSLSQTDLTAEVDAMVQKAQSDLVAGRTTDYVNREIEKHMK